MNKITAIFDLFRVGSAVQNPRAWKVAQMSATGLVPLILWLANFAKAQGYDLHIDEQAANYVGGAVVVIANVVGTLITSGHVGILPAVERVESKPAASSVTGHTEPDDPRLAASELQRIRKTGSTDPFADRGA